VKKDNIITSDELKQQAVILILAESKTIEVAVKIQLYPLIFARELNLSDRR